MSGAYWWRFPGWAIDARDWLERHRGYRPQVVALDVEVVDFRRGQGCPECWRQDGVHNSRCPLKPSEGESRSM